MNILKRIKFLVTCNSFNYATLNQLCIQAHSSSLRCGGSRCKVQSDKKKSVTPAHEPESPSSSEGVKIIQALTNCSIMRL